jgi:hypothetical protein
VRRDDLLARLAAGSPSVGPAARRVGAVVLGWLVLMTVWGFGRAWHGGLAPVELTIGLVAGTATTVVAWRRAARRDRAS